MLRRFRFLRLPLPGIKPVDTRPRAVAQMRAPFEYAAQQRQKEEEIADLNQKYKQAYIDYNKARRAVEAAGKGRGTANYTTAKNKIGRVSTGFIPLVKVNGFCTKPFGMFPFSEVELTSGTDKRGQRDSKGIGLGIRRLRR